MIVREGEGTVCECSPVKLPLLFWQHFKCLFVNCLKQQHDNFLSVRPKPVLNTGAIQAQCFTVWIVSDMLHM